MLLRAAKQNILPGKGKARKKCTCRNHQIWNFDQHDNFGQLFMSKVQNFAKLANVLLALFISSISVRTLWECYWIILGALKKIRFYRQTLATCISKSAGRRSTSCLNMFCGQRIKDYRHEWNLQVFSFGFEPVLNLNISQLLWCEI